MGQENEIKKIEEIDLFTDKSQHNKVTPVENLENKENIVKLEDKELNTPPTPTQAPTPTPTLAPTPTQTVETNAEVSKDKVRELLGPSLTPEEREKKNKELTQKQRDIQKSKRMRPNSGTNSTNSEINNGVDVTTTSKFSSSPSSMNIEPRENFISQAVNFLSSPNIIKAEEEKKTQFLLSKGLTRKEIEIAKEKVKEKMQTSSLPSTSTTTTVSELPVVPPRTYSPQTLPLVNVPPQKQIIGKPKIWKNLFYVLLFTGAFSLAFITAIKKLLGPVVSAIIFAKQQLYSHQLSLIGKLNEKLSPLTSQKKEKKEINKSNDNDKISDDQTNEYEEGDLIMFSSEDKYEMLSSKPPSLLAPLSNDLSNLTERIHSHQKNVLKNEAMEDLQQSLTSLATYLSANLQLLTNNWSVYGNGRHRNDPTAEQVKTEIRSIKGLLIGRSNFPKIPINRSSSYHHPSSPSPSPSSTSPPSTTSPPSPSFSILNTQKKTSTQQSSFPFASNELTEIDN
ncbi:hypothetical protein Glove_37g75 [Diversispora epigaea]|uniref:Peroxisomal membrane protein PEX14 n=1 Tax=Diversispora epigaea TaxID=1348612 RepID=A0A397JMX9_9GLOM|nr:hypothetical protein Glove_37g75 [Diversispora epigaea]